MPEQIELLGMKKQFFAAEIQVGSIFDDIFLLENLTEKATKKGSPYWNVTLRDRTGTIEGKVWESGAFPEGKPPQVGCFVKIRAEAQKEWKGDGAELSIKKMRALQDGEGYALEDFVPIGPNDRFAVIKRLEMDLHDIRHPGLRAVCLQVVQEPGMHMLLRDAPAASKNHQPYVGGLLDHIMSLMGLARAAYLHYRNVDQDLLIAACLLHDIGKIRELQWDKSIGYSVEGRLIGHVVIGMEILDRLRPVFLSVAVPDGSSMDMLDAANTVWLHLRHIVASHHGNLEWGAAKIPMTREAMLFHELDMLDSRMGSMDIVDKEPVDCDGFTSWIRTAGGSVWKP